MSTLLELEQKIDNLALVAGTDARAALALIGGIRTDLTALGILEASHQQSLASSLTTLQAQFAALDLTALIADGVVAATTTWSSAKITQQIALTVTEMQGGAPEAANSFGELLALIAADQTGLAGLLAVQAKTVRVDVDQTTGPGAFTGPEQDRALANIGGVKKTVFDAHVAAIGAPTGTVFVDTYNNAKNAA